MVTYTTTYNLKKPTVGQDDDLWGGYANDTYDLIDDLLDGTTPVTGIDINSGTLDNVVIGGTTANTGTFTVLSATTSLGVTGNITVSGTVDGVDIATRDGVLTTTTTTANAALPKAGGTMTGAITFATGQTFDGRDVSADGTKLDGIESGATADQTASEILTLIKTVDGAGSGLDADTLDGISSASFLRSDTNDTTTGDLTISKTAATINMGYAGGPHGINFYDDDGSTLRWGFYYRTSPDTISFEALGSSSKWTLDSSGNVTQSGTLNGGTPWTSANDGAGSGLDADLWDGNQFSSYLNQAVLSTSSPSFAGLNINGSLNAVDNIYLAGTLYHEGDTNTSLAFGTDTITLYAGGSSEITVNTTGVRLGDTGNGYFRPVSGNYGSIEIDGGAHTGWEGYSIGGRVVFMHDNSNSAGIYNDVNNEWMLKCDLNGAVQLYHNNSSKLDTLSNGVSINGNLYVDNSVAEDWDSLSGTTPTCNVDAAGAFSLTMTGNTTFTFSGADNNWSQGFVLQLTGNGSTVTWPTSVKWAGGTAPDAPASGETDIYVFWTRDGGTNWYGVLSSDAAA
jgi:hypothetical protein